MGSGASTSIEAFGERVDNYKADIEKLCIRCEELTSRIGDIFQEQAEVEPKNEPLDENKDHGNDALSQLATSIIDGGISKTSQCSGASSYSSDAPHPPGPLVDGDYIWKPSSPFKFFRTSFGDAADDIYEDVSELTLTHFLGSGAEGTVYKANYRISSGETLICAVKIAGAFPDFNPDTHAAIELLRTKERKELYSVYEREKRAYLMLRPRSETQWRYLACGNTRMLQLLGFNDAAEAVISEYIEGVHPDDDQVMDSVHALLKVVQETMKVEVGDLKLENLIQDSNGKLTIIDFGHCSYLGGATCNICNKSIESEVDAHASEHTLQYMKSAAYIKRGKGPVSWLRLQEFCFGESFC